MELGPFLQSRSATQTIAPLGRILAVELLRTSAELLLKCDVSRSLDRRHEPREFLLLGLDDQDALLLESDGCVEQVAHLLLVRLASRSHLLPQLAPRFALLCRDLSELGSEAGVGLLQLRHLRIGESHTVLGQLRHALAKLLLEGRPIRLGGRSGDGLCRGRRPAQSKR